MKRALAAALTAAVLAAGCGSEDASESSRPPLESPPNPGPIPDNDGLSPSDRSRLAASTVRVTGIACGRTSEGSGFAVADHLIATNAHVLVGLDEPMIEQGDGTTHRATVVAFDAERDLALLQVDQFAFVPLPLGTAVDGTIGALFGWDAGPTADAAPTLDPAPFRVDRPVTVRIEAVASTERIDRPSWLVAAEIESGDSGGALIDSNGFVIGIAYATTTRSSAVGYAVRADELGALIEEGLDDNVIVPDC